MSCSFFNFRQPFTKFQVIVKGIITRLRWNLNQRLIIECAKPMVDSDHVCNVFVDFEMFNLKS